MLIKFLFNLSFHRNFNVAFWVVLHTIYENRRWSNSQNSQREQWTIIEVSEFQFKFIKFFILKNTKNNKSNEFITGSKSLGGGAGTWWGLQLLLSASSIICGRRCHLPVNNVRFLECGNQNAPMNIPFKEQIRAHKKSYLLFQGLARKYVCILQILS